MPQQKFDQYGNPIYMGQTQQFAVPTQTMVVPTQQGQYQTGYMQVPVQQVQQRAPQQVQQRMPQQVQQRMPQQVSLPVQQFNPNQQPQISQPVPSGQFVNYQPAPVYATGYISAPVQGAPTYVTGQISAPSYDPRSDLEKKLARLQELFNERIITADEYYRKKQELITNKLKTF